MKLDRPVLILAALFGVLAWCLDAVMDWAYHSEEGHPFWQVLVSPSASHEFLVRPLLLISFLGFGVVAARMMARLRRAEAQARTSRRRQSITFDSIGDAVLVTDAGGRVTRLNRMACELTGWTEEEARGRSVQEVCPTVHSETREPVPGPVELVLREGRSVTLPENPLLLARDGAEYRISDSAAPLCGSPGGPLQGVVLVFRNVTEQHDQETTLRRSEARARSLIQHAPVGVHMYELRESGELIFVGCNDAADRFTGVRNEPLLGKTLEHAFPGLLGTEVPDRYREVARDGVSWSALDFPYEDRQIKGWFDVHAFQTVPGQMAVMFQEISERKRAADALREREEQLERTILEAPFPVMVHADDGEVRMISRVWLELTGYRAEEIRTVNAWAARAFGTVSERVLADLQRLYEAQGRVEGGELPVTCADGSVRTWSFSSAPLGQAPDGRRQVVTMAVDVTDRNRLQEQLRSSEKMTAVGQLAGGIAHDFNNLLAGILGYADMLSRLVEDEQLRQYATRIVDASTRAAELTQLLLAFARKGQVQRVPVDLHRIIGEVVGLLQRTIDRRVTIGQHLEASPSVTVGDPAQLQTALLNISLNARDAMPEGGELHLATETIELDEDTCRQHRQGIEPGPYIKVSITDTGCGMDRETQRRIFEPFFTTKEGGRGTGMGLAAAYGTVNTHGGAIAVSSEPGQGTTVTVYLPVQPGLPTGTAAATRPAEGAGARDGARILLVEDEEMVRQMAASLLEELGHQVIACVDGQEAVARYRELWREIDLVLLDMVMPGLGGRETFRALKEINPRVRGLLVSGYSLQGEAQRILDEGVLGFVQKPFSLRELSRLVTLALETAPAPSPAPEA